MGYWETYYHAIWGTKHRLPLIDDERECLLQGAIRSTCARQGAFVFAIGVMPDHVHLAVSIPPSIAVSEFMRLVKGSSSHLINKTSKRSAQEEFTWQAEFGVLTFGERSLDDVRSYVANQRQHHGEGTLLPRYERLQPPPTPKTTCS